MAFSEHSAVVVLVVDDNELVRYGIRQVLHGAGIQIREARTGGEALSRAAETPALILLDVDLPDISGHEVCRRLKSNPATASIPVVQMSGHFTKSRHCVEGLDGGADDYLIKPMNTAELLARVKVWLRVRRSEEHLRLAIHASRMVAWEWKPQTDEFRHSQNLADVYGLPRGATLGSRQEFMAHVHPADRQGLLTRVEAATANQAGYVAEFRLMRPDNGAIQWMEERGEAIVDDCGKAGRICGVTMDVSLRKATEVSLWKNERMLEQKVMERTTELRLAQQERNELLEQYQVLTESIPQMVWIADAESTLLYVNRRCADYSGLTPQDLLGQGWHCTVHPDDLPGMKERILHSLRTEAPLESHCRLHRADGEYRWHIVRALPLRNEDGKVGRWFGTSTDVHEQMLAQEAVLANERRFRAIIEKSYDAFAIITVEGTITYASPSIVRIGGRAPEEIVGKNALEWSHPDDPTLSPQEFREFLQRPGESLTDQRRYRHKDGSWRWVEVASTNFLDEPSVQGIVCNFHDVTEQRNLEEQFRQSQKLEAVGRLAGGIAHDFNNLLTVINGYGELLSEILYEQDESRSLVEEIRRAGQRAADLTRQLLAFSRKQIIQQQDVDLNAVVADVHKLLCRTLGEDVQLSTSLKSHLRSVKADAGQLQQILVNLAVNARDAMPGGGMLGIRTEDVDLEASQADDRSEVRAGPYVLLSVTDSGCGMSSDVMSHIFEPFFTTKEQGKGTGLGLATVYGIVKQFDGHIRVQSEVGRGTIFKIYLPACEASTAANVLPKDKPQLPRGAETILLVEDENGVRAVASRLLLQLGYRVITATNGTKAVEMAGEQAGRIDLLLTDVVMPGLSGPNLADTLQEQWPEMKVLYMSGYTDDAVVRHGVSSAEVAFLQKPFSVGALAVKVREVLDSPVPQLI